MTRFNELMQGFEAKGAKEKQVITKLRDNLAKIDGQLVSKVAFASYDSFKVALVQFFDSIVQGNIEKIKEMINTLEIRSIPVNVGLFGGQELQCSAILHLINNSEVPDEKIIDII